MADHWHWTPDETGLDDADFPPLDFGMDDDVDDDTPCPYCGEDDCEPPDQSLAWTRSRLRGLGCTGALPADEGEL